MLIPSGRVMLSANVIGDDNAHHQIRHRARHGLRGGVALPLQRFALVVPCRRPRRPRHRPRQQSCHVLCSIPGALAPSMRHTHRVNACRRLVCRVVLTASVVSSIRRRTPGSSTSSSPQQALSSSSKAGPMARLRAERRRDRRLLILTRTPSFISDGRCDNVLYCMKIVTIQRLNHAMADVIRDLDAVGVWSERLHAVDVYLVWAGTAYGWKYDGARGHIEIPAVSLSRVGSEVFGFGQKCGLRDVVRHEYGHAVADLYPRLTRTRQFVQVFGGSYARKHQGRGCDATEDYVSSYAATRPCEDFAETWMYYIKHRGRLPSRFHSRAVRQKWRFVQHTAKAIASGNGMC